MTCEYCYEDLEKHNTLYLDDKGEKTYQVCLDCVKYQKNNKVQGFVTSLRTEDCIATIRRMLFSGIPIYFDKDVEIFYSIIDGQVKEKILSLFFKDEELHKIIEINKRLLDLLIDLDNPDIIQKINRLLDQFI